MAACPFSSKKFGTIHDLVKSTVATTPLFNGLFKNLDDIFGYGLYPGYDQLNYDQADYVDPTPEMRDFYNEWWDQEPKIHGMWNTTQL